MGIGGNTRMLDRIGALARTDVTRQPSPSIPSSQTPQSAVAHQTRAGRLNGRSTAPQHHGPGARPHRLPMVGGQRLPPPAAATARSEKTALLESGDSVKSLRLTVSTCRTSDRSFHNRLDLSPSHGVSRHVVGIAAREAFLSDVRSGVCVSVRTGRSPRRLTNRHRSPGCRLKPHSLPRVDRVGGSGGRSAAGSCSCP